MKLFTVSKLIGQLRRKLGYFSLTLGWKTVSKEDLGDTWVAQ